MAFVTISEDPSKSQFIPDDAKFTVVSIEPRGGSKHGYSEIIQKGRATGSIGLNLDPGTYRICINSLGHPDESERYNWVREFKVGEQDAAQMKKIRSMSPKWAKPVHTSDGARWNCQFPGGCRHRATSKVGAVMHEYKDHLGLDPMAASKEDVKDAAKKAMKVS